jgi:hypothetical protein
MSQGRVGGDTWRRQRIARYDDMFLKVTGGKGLVTCVILCRTGGASHFLTVSVKDSIILPDWEPECWKESFGFAWICWLSELMHVDTILLSLLINQYMSKQYLYGWYGYTQISSQLNTLVKLRLKLGGCIFKFVQDGWNHGSQYYWMCWRPQMSWKSYHVSSRSRLKIAKCFLHQLTLVVTGTNASECRKDKTSTIKNQEYWQFVSFHSRCSNSFP